MIKSKYKINIHAAKKNCKFIISHFNTCNVLLLYLINNVGKWKVCYFLKSHQEQEVDTSLWNIIIRYLLSILAQMNTTSVIKIDMVQRGHIKNGGNFYFLKYEVWLLNNNTSHAAVTLIPLSTNSTWLLSLNLPSVLCWNAFQHVHLELCGFMWRSCFASCHKDKK